MFKKSNTLKRILPGALVSIVLIGGLLYFVDFRKLAEAFRSANYPILAFALSLSFVWIAVRAIVWRTLLRNRASYRDVLLTVGEGYLLNNFLPFRLGEIGRAFLLSRKSDPSINSGQRMQFMEILPWAIIGEYDISNKASKHNINFLILFTPFFASVSLKPNTDVFTIFVDLEKYNLLFLPKIKIG